MILSKTVANVKFFLSYKVMYLPIDFAYCAKFADFYYFQLRTYERNRSCFILYESEKNFKIPISCEVIRD